MRMYRGKIRSAYPLAAIFAVSALCLFGCGLTLSQKQAIEKFSVATLAVGNAASSELAGMRREVISMNVQRIQLVGGKKGAPGLDDLDEAFTIDATLVRQRATEALVSYGKLLQTLVETDQREAIRQSSDALIASFNDLPEFYRRIDQETLDAVGHALQSVGGIWVEWKKAKAVRAIVNSTGDQIVRLCPLLKDDFDPDADGYRGLCQGSRRDRGGQRGHQESDQQHVSG